MIHTDAETDVPHTTVSHDRKRRDQMTKREEDIDTAKDLIREALRLLRDKCYFTLQETRQFVVSELDFHAYCEDLDDTGLGL